MVPSGVWTVSLENEAARKSTPKQRRGYRRAVTPARRAAPAAITMIVALSNMA
jgi:hypothetical protein